MIAFELPGSTELLLSKFQTRAEHHGDVMVTAMDMAVEWTTSNRSLDMLHPQLREKLCSAVPPEMTSSGDQGQLDVNDSGDLVFMMFKRLGMPLKWDLELTGYNMVVDWGTSDEYMTVMLCKLHKFEFELIEGGSCLLRWTISSSADISEQFVGHMGVLQQQKIYLRLLAPQPDTIDASSSGDAKKKGGRKQKAADESGWEPELDPATQAFVNSEP